MFGSPTPTKHTCWPASSRAAATIIISDWKRWLSMQCAEPSFVRGGGIPGTPERPIRPTLHSPRERPVRSTTEPDGADPVAGAGGAPATRSAPSFST